MDYLVFARWFGLVSLLLSLGILFNISDAREMARNMIHSESGYIMGGVLPVIFGSLSILFANSLEPSWALLITLVGGCVLLGGVFRVIFVRPWKKLLWRYVDQIPFLFSLFGLMFGVILLYIGFVAPYV